MHKLQSVLQSLAASPHPEPEETDYDVSTTTTSSISEHIVESRTRLFNATALDPKTPTRRSGVIQQNNVVAGTNTAYDEREKIKEFVDVNKMIGALGNLQRLVMEPNVDYDSFKLNYLQSTRDLTEAMNRTSHSSRSRHSKVQAVADRDDDDDRKKEVVMGIFLVSVQIFKVLIELGTPLLLQLTEMWKELLNNKFFVQCTNLLAEILLLSLTLVLQVLRKLNKWLNDLTAK